MEKRRLKIAGISLLMLSFGLASIPQLLATNPSILDTDPGTYVIVVLMMLFIMMAFSGKEKLSLNGNKAALAFGATLAVIYALAFALLRSTLSVAFVSLRIDALLLPIAIMAFIIMIFGFGGMRKLWHLPVYAIFASPLALMPLLVQDHAFAGANASLIYWFLRALGAPLSKSGLVIAAPGSMITISATCVSIGTFVALAMFLVPVAYFYEGSKRHKAAWLASGVAIMLALNVLRMLIISSVWAFSGISGAIATFHIFAGGIIFYATIAMMILAAGRYGLHVEKLGSGARADLFGFLGARGLRDRYAHLLMAIAIGIALLVFTIGYGGVPYAPGVLFFNASTATGGSGSLQYILGDLNAAHMGMAQLGNGSGTSIFALQNSTDVSNATYVFANVSRWPIPVGVLTPYSSSRNMHSAILPNGITLTSVEATSGNVTFAVNYFSKTHVHNGSAFLVNYEFFVPMGSNFSQEYCNSEVYGSETPQSAVQSAIYDAFSPGRDAQSYFLCSAYAVAAG